MTEEPEIQTWAEALQEIIDDPKIKKSIEEKGFHQFPEWTEFRKKYPVKSKPTGIISLDFWSRQHKILRKNNYYILRTGGGKFAILDREKFPKPYLDLNVKNAEQLSYDKDPNFKDLWNAFSDLNQEDTGLEHLGGTGVYKSLFRKLFPKEPNVKWRIGPRGNKVSKFKVYGNFTIAKSTTREYHKTIPLYDFDGQEELDYTLWTKDHILLFEAKSVKRNKGLDIGWHKMAYPTNRFRKYNRKIIPIYLLKWEKIYHMFVFPVFDFHKDGIIINDQYKLKPNRIFSVDFGNSLDNFQ